jgi:hypothetical protein
MALTRITTWEYIAESTDIVGNTIPGLSTVGARIFITDDYVQKWYICLPDLTIAPLTNPDSTSDGNSIINSPLLYDGFGRLRTSDSSNRFDIEFIMDKQPLLIDEVVSGGATATHNSNTRDITLAIVNTTTNTSGALYSHYDIPYTAGNSQLIDVTGVLDLANLGGGTAQVFLRTNITGSVVETTYDQSTWVSNTSGVNWQYSHILGMDFQSLKVGRIRYYLVQNGTPILIKEIYNDNIRNSGYWQRPTLPQYWRIYNDVNYCYAEMGYGDVENGIGIRYRMPKSVSATMRAICATVKSEGGINLLDMSGFPSGISTQLVTKTVGTTLIPILSIRMAATFNGFTNRGLAILEEFGIYVDNPVNYRIFYRPTLTGAVWTTVDSNSFMEFDTTATAITGGTKIKDDIVNVARNTATSSKNLFGRTIISQGRTGTSDILSIAAIRTTSTSALTSASFSWKEIR